MSDYPQETTGLMHYPKQGTPNWFAFNIPPILWRMGLGPLIGGNPIEKVLILSTWGRTSGEPRHNGATYRELDGIKYLISGWGEEADWYQNAMSNPSVTVQTASGTEYAAARRVIDPNELRNVMQYMLEQSRDPFVGPWLRSLDVDPTLEDVMTKRDRLVIVALDPSDKIGPPLMPMDLVWVWPVGFGILAGLWLLNRQAKRG